MKSFKEFIDKKTRDAKKQLQIVKRVLEKEGMSVVDFLEDEDPHIFLKNPGGRLSFDGVRIYKIGSNIAFRVQKEDKTHPYGKAYNLDVEDMFRDLLSDDMNEEKAGLAVVQAVAHELRSFFDKSAMAEKDQQAGDFDRQGDPLGRVMMRSTGTDYSSLIHNSTTSSPL